MTRLAKSCAAAIALALAAESSAVFAQSAPSIGAVTAYNVSGGGATLSASVNPQGNSTTVWFQYGLTTAYGSSTQGNATDNAESYSTWAYGSTGGSGFGPADYLEGTGGGIYLEKTAAKIDGTNSFGVFAGGGTGNTQGMDRQILVAQAAGTLSLSVRFNVSNTVAFSGINLKSAEGTHFGDNELISIGIRPGNGNNFMAVNGGAQTINLGSAIPGQIVDLVLTYDCVQGTYTLGAKFRASSTYTSVSGPLKATGANAAYLGFGNFNTGNLQDFICDDVALTTSASAGAGNSPVNVTATVTGLAPDTTYHFRAVAQSSQGLVFGPDQTFGSPLQPAANATYHSYDAGPNEARLYDASGHIALVGPDLAGNPTGTTVLFAPPSVKMGGVYYSMGPILSSTNIANGMQFVQSLAGTTVTAQLTFPNPGVMRYAVTNWNGLTPTETDLTAASPATEHFFGFGEKFDSLDQAGNRVHMLTYDMPGTKNDSSYKPVPWFMSSSGYGFHLATTAESWFDMRSAAPDRYTVQNLDGNLAFNVISGPKLTDVLTRFTGYTGRPFLPPPWVFGPWISSDIWRTGGEVRYAVTKHLLSGIPASAFVFDSPWEVGYNDLTWNMGQFGASGTYEGVTYNGFSSVNAMMTFFQQNGLKVVCWMTPFINTSSFADNVGGQNVPGQNTGQASNYAAGAAGNYFVRSSGSGSPLVENWWKGTGSPVDFTNPAANTWFTGQLSALVSQSNVTGTDGTLIPAIGGFKTDDGETTNGTNTYIPATAAYFDGRTGVDMMNGYCVEYHKTVASVLGTAGILMARSGFTGTGAYPGCWAGDNEPNFSTGNGLQSVIVAGESAGLSGLSVWGSDIGGYQNTNFESNPADLFMRWAQFGAFSPIMEMHRSVDPSNLLQYPWGYGTTALANYVAYTRLHTQLFPYLYTYVQEATQDGLPPMRALVLMNQADANTYSVTHTYQFGNELLVAPMNALNATSRSVYLPAGTWYDFWTSATYLGGQTVTWSNADSGKMPLFVKAGSIVPLLLNVPQTLCDANYVNNPAVSTMDSGLQFLIYPGSGAASFHLYDGTAIQSSAGGTVTNVTLNSGPRLVELKVWTTAPAGVERNGVRMPKFTTVADYNAATQGWRYSGGFLYVKFSHAGGAVQVGFGADSVGDGVSDSWRSYYGITDDTKDSDGDGMTNLQEYVAGTNPNDPGSCFAIQSSGWINNGTGFSLSWQSQPGLVYQVQFSADLVAVPWQPVTPNVAGTGGVLSWTDPSAISGKRFYRIAIVP